MTSNFRIHQFRKFQNFKDFKLQNIKIVKILNLRIHKFSKFQYSEFNKISILEAFLALTTRHSHVPSKRERSLCSSPDAKLSFKFWSEQTVGSQRSLLHLVKYLISHTPLESPAIPYSSITMYRATCIQGDNSTSGFSRLLSGTF